MKTVFWLVVVILPILLSCFNFHMDEVQDYCFKVSVREKEVLAIRYSVMDDKVMKQFKFILIAPNDLPVNKKMLKFENFSNAKKIKF